MLPPGRYCPIKPLCATLSADAFVEPDGQVIRERDDHLERFEFGSGHPATIMHVQKRSRRWWLLLVVVVLAAGAGGAYLYYFERDTAEAWLERTPLRGRMTPVPTRTRVYEWRDAQGNWQVSDRPPPDAEYQVKEYRSDQNVVPAPTPERK